MQDIVTRLDELAEVKAALAVTRVDYEAKRDEILRAVQAELDALADEDEPLFDAAGERITALEEEIRRDVLGHGASIRGGRLHAVFTRGRVSWDTRRLDQYADEHPEVLGFRSQGEPSVSIRLIK